MIKFFRKIRQSLLNQNKVSKYLLYAIGEIALVVIGILIALQINNRNERAKLVQKETEILHLFDESLSTDLKKFAYIIKFYERSKGSIFRVLDHLENDLPYQDTLAYDFFNTTLTYEQTSFINGPFETLKSAGVELISNPKLRKKILEIYDDWDPWMESGEKHYVDVILNAGLTMYKTRFDEFWGGTVKDSVITGVMHPINYEQLKEDKEYIYFLKTQLNLMLWRVENPIDDATTNGTILKNLIEEELKQRIKE